MRDCYGDLLSVKLYIYQWSVVAYAFAIVTYQRNMLTTCSTLLIKQFDVVPSWAMLIVLSFHVEKFWVLFHTHTPTHTQNPVSRDGYEHVT